MGKIIEAGNLPEGERVYLKKDMLGWRTVEPWKSPDTGKINWFNLLTGGKKNLVILIVLMILAGMLYAGVNELIGSYKKVAAAPCDFCKDCHEQTQKVLDQYRNKNPILGISGGEIDENEIFVKQIATV